MGMKLLGGSSVGWTKALTATGSSIWALGGLCVRMDVGQCLNYSCTVPAGGRCYYDIICFAIASVSYM